MMSSVIEPKLLTDHQRQIFSLERQLGARLPDLDTMGNYIPGNILVTNVKKPAVDYMNESGCRFLGHSLPELQDLGPEYFASFFIPEEAKVILENYAQMYQSQDRDRIYTFIHRVKEVKKGTYRWYFASAKLLFEGTGEPSSKVLLVVNEVNKAGEMSKKMDRIVEDNLWMKKNFEKYSRLTAREKEFITLLMKGYKNRDIAGIFSISPHTADTHRKNIIRKLESDSFLVLHKFASTFGLI